MVYKAELLEKGTNTRFVVTSRSDEPKALYEWYVKRGEAEEWIKDFKWALKADRLSCKRFSGPTSSGSRCTRGLLAAGRAAEEAGSGGRGMQLDTLRLLLIKIGGRVRQLLTKVCLHLAWGHPGQRLWHALSSASPERVRE